MEELADDVLSSSEEDGYSSSEEVVTKRTKKAKAVARKPKGKAAQGGAEGEEDAKPKKVKVCSRVAILFQRPWAT